MKSRNFSFEIPECLRDQISRRAEVRGVSRNDEMRSLVNFALINCGEADVPIQIPDGDTIRTVVWLGPEEEGVIRDRARSYQRAAGKELIRLFIFALDLISKRDLALISSMMQHQNQLAPSA